MRTVKLNVFQEQIKWMAEHRKADSYVFNAKGEQVQAIYISPIEQWRGRIAPDGTVNVPDMDYYNKVTDINEMLKTIDELSFYEYL